MSFIKDTIKCYIESIHRVINAEVKDLNRIEKCNLRTELKEFAQEVLWKEDAHQEDK